MYKVWKSNDDSIASVGNDGMVEANNVGQAIIASPATLHSIAALTNVG